MSILIGVGVVTTVSVIYLGKKGWQAFHRAVGITPGVLTYHDPRAPLSVTDIRWRRLDLDQQHLSSLTDHQLRQLQRIDEKVVAYEQYRQALQHQNVTPALDEGEFVLQKWLYTRLPEMLASHHHLMHTADMTKKQHAQTLMQEALGDIEQRLDQLSEQADANHLQELQVMRRYMSSHNSDNK